MQSYSLVVKEPYSLMTELYGPYNLEQELLVEGFDKSTAKSIVQWLVSGVAEYGIGALTLPAAGAGLGVGPVVETLMDSFFALDEIRGALQLYENAKEMLEDYKKLFDDCINAYDPKNLGAYYDTMVALIQRGVKDFFEAAGDSTGDMITEKIEEYVDKFKEMIAKMVQKLIDPIKAGIKLMIPDATIGLAAGEALSALLQSLAENAFDSLESAIGKFDLLTTFITDPDACITFFKDLFKSLGDMINEVIAKLKGDETTQDNDGDGISDQAEDTAAEGIPFESIQFSDELIVEIGIPIPGLPDLTAPLKVKALEFVIDKMNDASAVFIDLLDGVLKKVIPMLITSLGIYQILMTGDWKPPEEEVEEEAGDAQETKQSEEANERYDRNQKFLENSLRQIIREELYNHPPCDKIKMLGSN